MDIEHKIRNLATQYAEQLTRNIDQRVAEMVGDDTSHFLIYQVLGVGDHEGRLIDIYQKQRSISLQCGWEISRGSNKTMLQRALSKIWGKENKEYTGSAAQNVRNRLLDRV